MESRGNTLNIEKTDDQNHMRCLYCGKGLALLKRWTGGGEFCSDAHRQKYQEEYNQLALNRLLQAKPQGTDKPAGEGRTPSDSKPDPKPRESKPAALKPAPLKPSAEVQAPALAVSEPAQQPAAMIAAAEPPRAAVQAPLPAPAEAEPTPPDLGNFIPEIPEPAMAKATPIAEAEANLETAGTLDLPCRRPPDPGMDPWGTQLGAAGQVVQPSMRVLDYAAHRGERSLEVREFARSAPVLQLQPPLGGAGWSRSVEPTGVSISPHAPQGSPRLWQEPEKEFGAIATELGTLGRVAFRTTGLLDNEDGARQLVDSTERLPPAIEPAPAAEPDPSPVTRPMPLTLHGIAAGRGKPIQLFSADPASGLDVRKPRSTALPLRPLMILGPPAPERAAAPKADPRNQPPARSSIRPDTRSGNGKGSKPKPPGPKQAAKPAPRPGPPLPPPPQPAPPAPALGTAPQVGHIPGLASLRRATPASLWSGLPGSARIGLLVAALAVVGLFAWMLKGGRSANASGGPAVVKAVPVRPGAEAGSTAGWKGDWTGDLGSGRHWKISQLQSPAGAADYRLEFQAQILQGAIGWAFRAMDRRNFYAMKLETRKRGGRQRISLVRFAVIDGKDEPPVQLSRSLPGGPDTVYQIRLEAAGGHFVTWIQDRKVDEFTDDRIKTGGAGLFSEDGETASLKSDLSVIPMVVRR